jgi:lipopolysaccharide transport system ATP-binding protein
MISPGESVAIIGRNGAGESRLLKILSRSTEPSTGRITIRGRVGSLLEVGTGFHPELTGRENIYLNGAILGMSRGEVARNLDRIVDFAEIEEFLDTPVKRYISAISTIRVGLLPMYRASITTVLTWTSFITTLVLPKPSSLGSFL